MSLQQIVIRNSDFILYILVYQINSLSKMPHIISCLGHTGNDKRYFFLKSRVFNKLRLTQKSYPLY